MIPLYDDNPTRRMPVVTVLFIAINVLVYLYQVMSPRPFESYLLTLGAVPYEIVHMTDIRPAAPIPLPLTLLTSMFMHAGFLHLAGNMLYLWIFGNNVEDRLGHAMFVLFYLACGLAAAFGHILFNFNSTIPMVGASGAIAGVLGAYLVLFPGARVYTLIPIPFLFQVIPVPAFFMLGLWFVLQLLSAAGGAEAGVAFMAHVAGFVAGVALILLVPRRSRPTKYRY